MNRTRSALNRPLRIVTYTDAAGIGGAEISLGHLVAGVAPGIELTVVGVATEVVAAIAAQRPGAAQMVLSERSLLAHLRGLRHLRPDLVHCNLCTPWAAAIGLTAALMLPQVRVVRVDQLPLRTTAAWLLWRTRALALRVDAHVAVGEASARRMEDFYALGRNTVLSIPNGVPDLGLPVPAIARPRGELVVGSVGRLDAMKAHDILLKAIAPLPGVRLVILGEGNQRQALEQLAASLGIADRVELRGWVNHPRDHLPQFDAIALPSRSEGFPLAMVEAMLAARPVVATRVGSIPEAIQDGVTGLLVEKNDIAGLTLALQRLRDHPDLRHSLGHQGRQVAIAQFTAAHMVSRYEQLWQRLVQTPPVPRLRVPRPQD